MRTPRTPESGWEALNRPHVAVVHQHRVRRAAGDGIGEEEVDLAVAIEVGHGDSAWRHGPPRPSRFRRGRRDTAGANAIAGPGATVGGFAGRRRIKRDGHRQWSHPRVLELGHLRPRIALERLESFETGLSLGRAAEPLQRLEGAVVGAAQQRVERLRLVEPRQRRFGGIAQSRLTGEVGWIGVAWRGHRHRVEQ